MPEHRCAQQPRRPSAFGIRVTPVRVVCANTHSAALRNHESSFSLRHTRNARAAAHAARDALGLTFTCVDAFQVEAERLMQQTRIDSGFDVLIDATIGKAEADTTKRVRETARHRRSRLHWLFADGRHRAGTRETAWAGYSAVAEYVDHDVPRSGPRATRPPPALRECSPATTSTGSSAAPMFSDHSAP